MYSISLSIQHVPQAHLQKRARSITSMGEPRRFVLTASWLLLAAPGLAAPPPPPAGTRQAQTQAQLQALKTQIAAIRDQVSQDAVASDKAAQDLQTAEVSVTAARAKLADLRHER